LRAGSRLRAISAATFGRLAAFLTLPFQALRAEGEADLSGLQMTTAFCVAITPALFEPAEPSPAPQEGRIPMAKITGNEISPGTLIDFDGGLWIAVKTQKVKPGKGGAYNQVELKNVTQGTKLNQRFRSDETVEEVYLEKKDFQFLYASGDMLTFMDMETYDQIELATDFVGDQAQFLQDGMKTLVQMHDGKPIGIKLPVQVTLAVIEADPVLKGGTAAPSYKSAVLENGMKIQVPPFIGVGEKLIVATEDGSYVRRAES
jgi:elongation factor P